MAGLPVPKQVQTLLKKLQDPESAGEFACLYWLDGNRSEIKTDRDILNAYEASRLDKYHFPQDRSRFFFGRLIVRSVLAGVLGCHPRDVPLKVESGRPFLDPGLNLDLHFSISHAANAVLVSFRRDFETGIDIERQRTFENINDVARRVMTDREHEQYRALQGADAVSAFYRLWTRKEAVLKLMGTGFSVSPDQVSTGFEAEGKGFSRCRGIGYTLHGGVLEHAGQRFSWAHAKRGNQHSEIPLFHIELIVSQVISDIRGNGESTLTL